VADPPLYDHVFVRKNPAHRKLVVFVPGALGDLRKSWLNGETAKHWFDLMLEDPELKDFDLLLYGYSSRKWGDGISLQEVSTRMMQSMKDSKIFEDYDEICVVAHSTGGLVVAQVLISLNTLTDVALLRHIRCVTLLSTPANGTSIARAAQAMGWGRQGVDLRDQPLSSWLIGVQDGVTRLVNERNRLGSTFPKFFVGYETVPTLGIMVIGRPGVAGLLPDQELQAFSLNHFQMAAPATASDPLYVWVKDRILQSTLVPPKIAVVSPEYSAPEKGVAWQMTGFAEVLTELLRQEGWVEAIARDRVVSAEGGAMADTRGPLAYYRHLLGADFVVRGSYRSDGDGRPRLTSVRLESTATREPYEIQISDESGVVVAAERAEEEILAKLLDDPHLSIPRRVASHKVYKMEAVEALFEFSGVCATAQREYFDGLGKLQRSDFAGAVKDLRAAAGCAAASPLVHKALARALYNEGDDKAALRAIHEAAKKLAERGIFPDRERGEVEALACRMKEEDLSKAVTQYATLRSQYPAGGYELLQAESQLDSNNRQSYVAALRTIHDAQDESTGGWVPELDLLEAEADWRLNRFSKAVAAVRLAENKVPGAKEMVARAKLQEAKSLVELGDAFGARAALEQAQGLFHELKGAGRYEAECIELRASHRTFLLPPTEIDTLLVASARLYTADKDHGALARVLLKRSVLQTDLGNYAEALRLRNQAMAEAKRGADPGWEADVLREAGIDSLLLGDLKRAEDRLQRSAELFDRQCRQAADRRAAPCTEKAKSDQNLAEVYFTEGKLAQAEDTFRSARRAFAAANENPGPSLAPKVGAGGDIAYCTYWIGRIRAADDDPEAALGDFLSAIEDQNGDGEERDRAISQVARAELLLQRSRLDEAERDARSAVHALQDSGALGELALAEIVLGEVKMRSGHLAEAEQMLKQVKQATSRLLDFRVCYRRRILDALITSRSRPSQVAASLHDLALLAAEARKAGNVAYEVATLLATIEIKHDHGLDSKEELAALTRPSELVFRSALGKARNLTSRAATRPAA
jgi:tetratricopeptide (TPR) repeat protein